MADDFIDFDPDDLGGVLVTVARAQKGHGRYIKQTISVQRFAEVKVVVEPYAGLHCFRFIWRSSQTLPKAFMKSACFEGVKTALFATMHDGRRAAFLQVTMVDGSYHDVDTDAASLEIAAYMAVMDALQQADVIDA